MGFANFLRPFVPHFAQVAAPLHKLNEEGPKMELAPRRTTSVRSTMLYMVDPTLPFIVQTDASDTGARNPILCNRGLFYSKRARTRRCQ